MGEGQRRPGEPGRRAERAAEPRAAIRWPSAPQLPPAVRDAALDTGPTAQMVVDVDGTLLMANARARSLFGFGAGDVGRPLRDAEVSYRPPELRSCIARAYAEGGPVRVEEITMARAAGAGDLWLAYEVVPLGAGEGAGWAGVSVGVVDVTEQRRLREQLVSSNRQLETVNEELQSTIEELETTSEDLRSTNEELERMNEELQSTNEEVRAVNAELRERTAELDRVNEELAAILRSLPSGVAVVGPTMLVRLWNRAAEDLWGVHQDEVAGSSLLGLDIGLPVAALGEPLRRVVEGQAEQERLAVDAVTRRGRGVRCTVSMTPLGDGGVRGAILLMDAREQR